MRRLSSGHSACSVLLLVTEKCAADRGLDVHRTRFTMKLKFSVTKKPDLVTRFSALIDAENLKTFSKSFATSAVNAGAAPASPAEVPKDFEKVLRFSASIKAQNRVTRSGFFVTENFSFVVNRVSKVLFTPKN